MRHRTTSPLLYYLYLNMANPISLDALAESSTADRPLSNTENEPLSPETDIPPDTNIPPEVDRSLEINLSPETNLFREGCCVICGGPGTMQVTECRPGCDSEKRWYCGQSCLEANG
jgi:hypothetical protein